MLRFSYSDRLILQKKKKKRENRMSMNSLDALKVSYFLTKGLYYLVTHDPSINGN